MLAIVAKSSRPGKRNVLTEDRSSSASTAKLLTARAACLLPEEVCLVICEISFMDLARASEPRACCLDACEID